MSTETAQPDETPADFCRWLLTLDDPESEQGREDRRTVRLSAIIDRARAALDYIPPTTWHEAIGAPGWLPGDPR
ncbi:hypothetical protein [uncultured Arthrobacter sp.]|uniref:hypothetical protein n=1 Tax=uncultured Arthrobacter sp. TaxID=114050 RepID=UPI0025DF8EE6|nr:hypothetical protein [uncultured Arthrobacter sp.]